VHPRTQELAVVVVVGRLEEVEAHHFRAVLREVGVVAEEELLELAEQVDLVQLVYPVLLTQVPEAGLVGLLVVV
jgi:hypothetical protein